MAELSPETSLSHYRIISKIGVGGMGEVYLAQDTKLDRKAHRYDDAIAQFQKALEIEPNFFLAHYQLAQTYLLKGMYEQSTDRLQKVGFLSEKDAADLKEAFRRSGERGFWQKRLEMATEKARAGNRQVDPFNLGELQLGIGNKEQALDSLEKAVPGSRGNVASVSLRSEPKWDPLRAEPRFKELLRKVGLPE